MQLLGCRAVATQVVTLFRPVWAGPMMLGVALALGACAHTAWAPGPYVNVADFEPAKARCSLFARHSAPGFAAYGPPKYVAGAAIGYAIGNAVRQNEDFDDCMVASG